MSRQPDLFQSLHRQVLDLCGGSEVFGIMPSSLQSGHGVEAMWSAGENPPRITRVMSEGSYFAKVMIARQNENGTVTVLEGSTHDPDIDLDEDRPQPDPIRLDQAPFLAEMHGVLKPVDSLRALAQLAGELEIFQPDD